MNDSFKKLKIVGTESLSGDVGENDEGVSLVCGAKRHGEKGESVLACPQCRTPYGVDELREDMRARARDQSVCHADIRNSSSVEGESQHGIDVRQVVVPDVDEGVTELSYLPIARTTPSGSFASGSASTTDGESRVEDDRDSRRAVGRKLRKVVAPVT